MHINKMRVKIEMEKVKKLKGNRSSQERNERDENAWKAMSPE